MFGKGIVLASIMVGLVGVEAAAQKSNTSGFMLNLHLSGASITRPEAPGESNESESGGGYGARIGWGFTPKLTGFLGLDAAAIDFKGAGATGNFALGHFDLGMTYNFAGSNKQFVPYLEAALTTRAIVSEEDGTGNKFEQAGAGFTLGAGFNYFFSRSWAFNAGLMVTGGSFEDAEFAGSDIPDSGGSATSSRVNLGVTWYPMKK